MQLQERAGFADGAAVGAALVAGTLALLVLLVLPAFVVALARDYGLNAAQLGYFSSADLGGMTLGSAMGVKILRRCGLRLTSRVGLALAIAGDSASALVGNYVALLVLRVFAEVGAGFVVTVCYVTLARSRRVDRDFCLWPVIQGSLGALSIEALPWLSAHIGARGVFASAALALGIALGFTRYLPGTLGGHAPKEGSSGSREAWIGLGAIFTFFVAQGAMWTYLGIIGTHAGISPHACDTGLAIASVVGLSGPLVMASFGARLGRTLPLLVGIALIVIASAQLQTSVDSFLFALVACLFTLAWNLSTPYQLSSLTVVDPNSQVIGLAASVSLAGFALGPLTAALFLSVAGFGGVIWISCGLCMLSFAGMIPALAANARGRKTSESP